VTNKITFDGRVLGVQPRIRLTRSFDQRSHSYLGYVLRLSGYIDDRREMFFTVGLGKAAYAKHQIEMGDYVSGLCLPVADSRTESSEYYKVSKLKLEKGAPRDELEPPPWDGVAPDLEEYRERGHRRLSARTYKSKCITCIWGCEMPVEIIVDQWNPSKKRYRREAFCYGPKSCPDYAAGPTRKVPGRNGMTWEEEDWVDEDATAHRGPDD
jgi:hypothetical protein